MFAAGPSSSPLSYCTVFLVGTCHPNLGLPSPPPETGMMGSWVQKVALGGEGNGNPLQYSCLENPMDGGAWWATVHGVAKSQTRLSNFTFTFIFCIFVFNFLYIVQYLVLLLSCSALSNSLQHRGL